MRTKNNVNRRDFLETSTLGAVGLFMPQNKMFNIIKKNDYLSTKYVWYRRVTDGPYIETQLNNKGFGFTVDKVFLSHDNCHTWNNQLHFWDAKNITFSHIFQIGNILFGTRNRLY